MSTIDYSKLSHLLAQLTWLVPSKFSGYWLARFASAGWRLLLNRMIECSY